MDDGTVRIRHQEGRSQQSDRPRGRRGAPARALEVGGDRRVPGRRAAVLGVAALRAAAPRLSSSRSCSASGRRRKKSPAISGSRSRRCAHPSGSRRSRPSGCTWSRPSSDEAIVIERVVPADPPANRSSHAGDERIRRASARDGERRASAAPAGADWRATLEAARRRAGRRARRSGWSGSRPGSIYLQVVERADLVARAERQQMRTRDAARQARRHPRPPRPRARDQRRRRHDLRGAVGYRETQDGGREAVRRARRLHARKERQDADRAASSAARLRLRAPAGLA